MTIVRVTLRRSALAAYALGALFACSTAPILIGDGGSASGPPAWIGLSGDRLGPLPPHAGAASTTFTSHEQCAQCHAANQTSPALRDAKGRDVSPVDLWRGSMMAQAARDPYYLAEVAHEEVHRPGARAAIEKTCLGCHAPEGVQAGLQSGTALTLAALVTGQTTEAKLGREGVACTLCHQITATGLGSFQSFGGNFVLGDQRQIFGPHMNPNEQPMRMFVNYVPTAAQHVQKSSFCASCHTVITRALDANGKVVGPEFLEQAPYLEWRASAYTDEGAPGARAASCQSCHVPVVDDDKTPINTVIATAPQGLMPRSPLGRHTFVGGNAQVLGVLSDNVAWSGTDATAAELATQAARAKASLESAVKVTIARSQRSGEQVEVVVRVENQTGHKFPTGYPSRRAWLHVKMSAGGGVAFESGRADAYGRIVDRGGAPIDAFNAKLVHRDVVDAENTAQIWELVPGDANGRMAATPLDATQVLKDDRLLPFGYQVNAGNTLTNPVGVEGDADFGASDDVTFRARISGAVHVDVELLFQSVRPQELEALAKEPTPTALRLFDMLGAKAMTPLVIATAAADVN